MLKIQLFYDLLVNHRSIHGKAETELFICTTNHIQLSL